MDIEIDGNSMEITAMSENRCSININGVDVNDLIDQIRIKDFINRHGIEEILAEIDEKEAANIYGWNQNET